jgi:hypothetical protein
MLEISVNAACTDAWLFDSNFNEWDCQSAASGIGRDQTGYSFGNQKTSKATAPKPGVVRANG